MRRGGSTGLERLVVDRFLWYGLAVNDWPKWFGLKLDIHHKAARIHLGLLSRPFRFLSIKFDGSFTCRTVPTVTHHLQATPSPRLLRLFPPLSKRYPPPLFPRRDSHPHYRSPFCGF
ncbi:hypothetical protein AVEN_209767-1 [Araneus ventricosus]|uniref:Uncharacterized protein n=1 Tax=Araneus ventricosus TaxID=182803 RepID=A0A4Y2CCC0_ARAVE|nr:hypothetical protein AVEN_209767-1 [Araneus ventricosus]